MAKSIFFCCSKQFLNKKFSKKKKIFKVFNFCSRFFKKTFKSKGGKWVGGNILQSVWEVIFGRFVNITHICYILKYPCAILTLYESHRGKFK